MTLEFTDIFWSLIEVSVCVFFQAMVGILQGKARGGEEESILMHDLKPFRILISLLDKPELGNQSIDTQMPTV